MIATQYERPSSVKLASVKHELYHPRLPTLRRMDIDTTAHRLSTEHTRTTTTCSREDFVKSRSTYFPKREPLHCKNVLNRRTQTAVQNFQPLKTESYTENWARILGMLNSRSAKHEHSQHTEPLEIIGLAIREKHPNITSSWQARCASAPNCSRPTTPKPIPATMYSRYRTTVNCRPFSPNPWNGLEYRDLTVNVLHQCVVP